jgi:hypothetical protein
MSGIILALAPTLLLLLLFEGEAVNLVDAPDEGGALVPLVIVVEIPPMIL